MEGTELALERMSLDKGGRGGLIVNTASLAGIGNTNGFMTFLNLGEGQTNCQYRPARY
jgi:hypothetical protein